MPERTGKSRNTSYSPVIRAPQEELRFGPPMVEIEKKAADILGRRRGHGQALQVVAMARLLRTTERAARGIVQGLINIHGLPIGSSVNPPSGYYWITDPDELDRTCRSLRHRGIAILVRASKLKKASLEAVFGQARLEYFGGDGHGRE